ncbi:hypothetical protein QFZ37_001676 [Chryseobacterium ginsenosidimutans]|nr:hypothetical protein [Chryseobacterium ginsenosidimutans]
MSIVEFYFKQQKSPETEIPRLKNYLLTIIQDMDIYNL